jgi:hypothetical protein
LRFHFSVVLVRILIFLKLQRYILRPGHPFCAGAPKNVKTFS